jgi:Protein of unknown function (DUF3106)
MTPQAQERFLRNYQRFQSLSPAERQQLLRRDQEIRRLPPADQDRLRENARRWQQLTPDQRDHIRNNVLPQWKALPPDRRQAVQRRLQLLQDMPESARNQRLNDPGFMKGLAPEDQSMLRDLSRMHVGGSPEPPPE